MSENNRDIQQGEKSVYAEKGNVFITYAGERRVPHALTPPPFLPEIFLGRDDDLKRIHDRLFAPGGNLLLLVNGEGGVGKTSIASKYFHDYEQEYAHVAWVLSEKSIAAALLLLALPLGLQFDEQMGTDQRLEILLQAMANLKKPCLLVLDNANELDDLEAHYQRLRRCSNFHLLLTTRITEFGQAETCRIEGLPEGEALELFRKYYPKFPPGEEEIFKQIRSAVGGNTLVVELLAKNLALLNRLKTRYSLADLLADLQGRGLLQLTQSQEVRTDYQSKTGQMRSAKPEDIIAAMYDLTDLLAEETALLSVFAVLPAESIPFATLEALLPGTPDLDTHLLALAQKGWLSMENKPSESSDGSKSSPDDAPDSHFKCSPVVQEVTRRKNPRLRKDCQPLVDALIEKLRYEGGTGHFLNATYDEALLFARYAEAVSDAFLEQPDSGLSILGERIGNYHITTGNIERGLFFFEKIIQNYEALLAAEPNNPDFKNGLAISYEKLGDTHTALGNLDKALTYFEDETTLFEELYASYPQNVGFKNGLAISYSKLGDTHTALGNLDKALTYFEERSRLGKELYASYPQNVGFKNGLAISYAKLGEFSRDQLKDPNKARTYFQQAESLWVELVRDAPQYVQFQRFLAQVRRDLEGLN
jgi:tetratricopeptide (TPR) repeat protein